MRRRWLGKPAPRWGWTAEEAVKFINHLLHLVSCQLLCDTAGQGILGHRYCSRVLTATLTLMGVCCDLQHLSVSAYWDFQPYLGHRVALVALSWESSAEQLLHYLHLDLAGQECKFFTNSIPWHGWGWDVPAPTVSDGAAGALVPCNVTQHPQEQTGLVQHRGLPARNCVSKWQPHCQSVPFMRQ